MTFPKPSAGAVRVFESLVAGHPEMERRKMFGHPCTFVNGNLCIGTFYDEVFLRLSEADRRTASKLSGVRPFAPMPGRPMREYLVFPASLLHDRKVAARWVKRSADFVRGLPPK